MKIVNKLPILVTLLIAMPCIIASPKKVTITNKSGSPVDFEILLTGDIKKTTPSLADDESRTFEFETGIKTVTARVTENPLLVDISDYHAPVTVIYNDDIFLEAGAYNSLYAPPSRSVSDALSAVAARFAAAWHAGGTMWQNLKTRWSQTRSAYKKPTISGLAQIYIHNELDQDIRVSIGETQFDTPPLVHPGKSENFGFKNMNSVHIYDPKDTAKAIKIIPLEKYTNNPKKDADLHIYIQKRFPVTNKLFGWMPNWSNITYDGQWIASEELEISFETEEYLQ